MVFKPFQRIHRANPPRPEGLLRWAYLQIKDARKGNKPVLALFYQYINPSEQIE